jgi:two-component system, OmpR family, sensor histidine kinase CpxA
MRSLFLKIFLSFWAALALSLVLAILATMALRPPRREIDTQGLQTLAEAVNAYQTGGERAAHEYLEGFWHAHHMRTFVFDSSGHELSGRSVPPWIEDIRQGVPPRGGPMMRRSWFDRLMSDPVTREALTLDGKRYTLIFEMPPGSRSFPGSHDVPGLGITIAIISSGLICYLLAWSLTSPVTRLRHTAQSLAAGDLSARTGVPSTGSRDELTELMRDFDRMAERIENLVNSQSRLLKDVSHELRSPLARLSVALGLARQKANPEVQNSLSRIELEADRLNQLIQRLLTIARLESGTDALHKTQFSLRELTEQIAHDAEYENPGKSCRVISLNSANGATSIEDKFLVQADPDLLRSAIENAVRNATRYTKDGTTVEVRLERQPVANGSAPSGDEIIVRVLDSGPGVPNEALQKIFEPFYRLDDARNSKTGGAGLGLSIADRAIRLHGGQLRASNRREGGLEVEFRIPAAPGFALPAHS